MTPRLEQTKNVMKTVKDPETTVNKTLGRMTVTITPEMKTSEDRERSLSLTL
jgi:hypothetical protein